MNKKQIAVSLLFFIPMLPVFLVGFIFNIIHVYFVNGMNTAEALSEMFYEKLK